MTIDLWAIEQHAEQQRHGYPPNSTVIAIRSEDALALIRVVKAAQGIALLSGPGQVHSGHLAVLRQALKPLGGKP